MPMNVFSNLTKAVLRALCDAGLPDGNVYEFAALNMLKFEKKFRAEQRVKELEKKFPEAAKKKKATNGDEGNK